MYNKLSKIALYMDEGVDAFSLRAAQIYFSKLCAKTHCVSTISCSEILERKLKSQVLVMPGGADLPYLKKLAGPGNALIRNFVETGGKYIGICAGAYYAASKVVFGEGTSYEVIGDRELKFLDGKCIGPIEGRYLAGPGIATMGTAMVAKVKSLRTKKTYDMIINGGGYFEYTNPLENNCTTIATIRINNKDMPIIVWCRYGYGAAILSGAHFEYDSSVLELGVNGIDTKHMITESMRENEESLRQEIRQLINEI